jgi:hypothetical protein
MGFQRTQNFEQRTGAGPELDNVADHEELKAEMTGGAVPAVHHDTDGGGAETASERGYQVAAATEDKNEAELKKKVGALVATRYGGSYRAAFDHYDTDKDDAINGDEMSALLAEAGVGNKLTRGMWVKGILAKLDTSHDGKISWAEFDSVFSGGGTKQA